MTDVKVALAADFDREIFWKGGRSVRYLVARVAARREDDGRREERAALNIALVIDASGSMRGDKLEAARTAAQGLAERLAPRDRLTIVSFASDVRVHIDAAPVTAGNSTRIQAEISRLETRGRTCLSGGWFAGVECAARVAEEDAGLTPRVIVLSDGLANEGIQDPAELCEHAGELRRRGVLTSALGIGDDYDERLLRGIAENGGGRLHDAETAAEISSVLLGELDDIFLTAVEDAEIAVAGPASARVAFVGTARTCASRGRMAVALGPFQNEIERVAVFKVTCPEGRNGDTLAFEVAASGRAAEGGAALRAAAGPITLTAAGGGANGKQGRNADLTRIVARVWRAHIVAAVSRMNREGAYRDASLFAARELRHFARYVDGFEFGREMIPELRMLGRHAGKPMSSRMHKEMALQEVFERDARVDRRGPSKPRWSERMARGE